ncbi:MAG: hypothetical protein P4L55_12200 [Syntrophobacteraceae bacterium]|nr:hypothetical protein [Syntrophobacteraceae bacterium]
MEEIIRRRCLNHVNREAVAVCTRCSHSFCRECVAEYDQRVVCARCLAALEKAPREKRARWMGLLQTAWCGLSFIFLWAVFYYLGKILLAAPSAFHKSLLGRMFQ